MRGTGLSLLVWVSTGLSLLVWVVTGLSLLVWVSNRPFSSSLDQYQSFSSSLGQHRPLSKQSNITRLGRSNIPLIIVLEKTVKHHMPGYAAALLFWLPYPYPPDKITWIFASREKSVSLLPFWFQNDEEPFKLLPADTYSVGLDCHYRRLMFTPKAIVSGDRIPVGH